MFVNVVPPLVLTCHCTVGVGLPLAAAVNVTGCQRRCVWLVGLVVTTGAPEPRHRQRRGGGRGRALRVGEHRLVFVAVLSGRRGEAVGRRGRAG